MNCKKVRDIILTDYHDKKVSSKQKDILEKHLTQCKDCREFAAIIKRSAIEPFKETKFQKVPDSVWDNIKEKIVLERNKKPYLIQVLIGRLKDVFYVPKAAFAVATVMVVVIVSGFFVRHYMNNTMQQIEYLASLLSNDSYSLNEEYTGCGTAIEEYFL